MADPKENIWWEDALELSRSGKGKIEDAGRVFIFTDGETRSVCYWEGRHAAHAQSLLKLQAKRDARVPPSPTSPRPLPPAVGPKELEYAFKVVERTLELHESEAEELADALAVIARRDKDARPD